MFLKNGFFFIVLSAITAHVSCAVTKPVPLPVVPVVVKQDTIPVKLITAPVVVYNATTDSFFNALLQQQPAAFDSMLQKRKQYNIQIIYTQVDRGANGMPQLKEYHYNVDSADYFYPASAVKLPVAMLTLQRLNELKDKGVDKNSTMLSGVAYQGQTAVYNDPTSSNGKPSIAQYLKKMLLANEADAFNRLYEFLGQQYIKEQLGKKGYQQAQIVQRLKRLLSADENRHTNPIQFLDSTNIVNYLQPQQVANKLDGFGTNKISLQDLHHLMVSLVLPSKVRGEQRFQLTENDRNFLLKYMGQWPTESTVQPYASDSATYYPAFSKWLLLGAQKKPAPDGIRLFNSAGADSAQLTDVAYIVDLEKGIEFFLSATIHCTNKFTARDPSFDYSTIGFPFMQHLGQVIYNYEIKRDRKYQPDLSGLKLLFYPNQLK